MEKSEHNTIAAYISEIDRIYRTGKATEHTYRGVLQQTLSALMPGFTVLNEPKKQECGAPDYIITDRAGRSISFVEAKDIGDADLDGNRRAGHKEQFDRYKASLDTIAFTDYLDFHLYLNGRSAGSVRIGEERDGRIVAVPEKFGEFLLLVEALATAHPVKITSAKQLAQLMAGKARMLQRIAEAYLQPVAEAYDSAESGAKPMPTPLLDMMLGFRNVLMPDVGVGEFSDIFAQTLTYGMFAARLNDPTPEDFSRYEAMGRIPNSNPFLKQLFQYVANNLEDELEWIVDDLADLFRAVDVGKVMKGYGKSTGASDPMVHFYEDFLCEYDAGLRKDRGVWYTPIQVVRFIVAAVDWALKSRFGLPDGLADSSTTQIEVEEATTHGKKLAHKVKKTVHRVQVLDPATGTGTFLAETVRQIRAKFDGNEGLWPEYVASNLLPRLNGFELLMASYTMAHVKLDYALRATGVIPTGKDRFRVFLTDSLTDWHKELPGGLFASALAAEQQGADEVKRDIPVMVVIGNPPYSGESQNKGDWIMRLMENYKVEPGGKVKLQERNPKWLNDDYVKFLRLAEHYVEKNGSGIVAYINPHGFLDNPTFRGMRWHLMQTFDEMYFLNLHGNAKKKEVAPDGGKDECVFNIMQGVSINLFVKKGSASRGVSDTKGCRVFYSDLWGLRRDKFAALETATMESIKWQGLAPVEPMLFFVPKDTAGEAEWNAGFGIAELMEVNGMGVTTGDDSTLVDNIVDSLLTNVAAKHGASALSKVRDFSYRPFDERLVYYDARLLARARDKFWGKCFNVESQSRRECEDIEQTDLLRHNCLPDSENVCGVRCEEIRLLNQGEIGNVALCLIRINSKDNGLPVFVTEKITDKTILSSKDNANVFPLWLYDENMGKVEKRANLNPEIVSRISASLRLCVKDISPEDIFAYIYGVLHTPQYLKKFKEFLKTDFPRIPYPKDAEQFNAVAEIGRSLIDAHLMRDAAPRLSETRARFPKMGSNIVEEVRFGEGRVIINAEQFFDNVPTVAWEMPIGGYRPAEKWLKDRKGRVLAGDDIKHYQRIIIALMKTAEAAERLDSLDKKTL